eukprot:TRINITY_DN2234_c0_g2_i2.p1 TRINITY_DN2234_c0_g2~~TRINITY_DN2234_c0_g2_i2.p1  ORF type:complete len:582 (+),score=72.59 TRINITY_DN2234_c0_g2_i2:144-1748(+)
MLQSKPKSNSNPNGFSSSFGTHWVSPVESDDGLSLLRWALHHSSVVGLDAEWKPVRSPNPASSFPPVSILQIACRVSDPQLSPDSAGTGKGSLVFLLDLQSIPLPSIWEMLRDMFVSPNVLKLGFKFKQDLIYLSSTFRSNGCDLGFEKVEPFLDVTSMYHYLHNRGKKLPKDTKSLAAVCEEVLGVSLSKELQCSDWSCRPLTEAQKSYAAADAYCLLEIFTIFQRRFSNEGTFPYKVTESNSSNATLGLKLILEKSDICENILRHKFCEASDMIKSIDCGNHPRDQTVVGSTSFRTTFLLDDSLSKIIRKYGERILLKESDRNPRISKRKGKRRSSLSSNCYKCKENDSAWQGPPPWDSSLDGDGCPKFLCDVMVEGLAKHLRCVGIDAATPSSKRPEPRLLLEQARKEKRVLLTRDAKLLKHQYLISNQVYQVKNLLKNDQLLEVIETFQLRISEDMLMSRCTKCNGRFIQKPLTTEEAIAAGKGFQVIPQCLYDRNIEFWQCTDCNQLYWEGTQYHNAVEKFINVCKLNE